MNTDNQCREQGVNTENQYRELIQRVNTESQYTESIQIINTDNQYRAIRKGFKAFVENPKLYARVLRSLLKTLSYTQGF